MSRIRLRFSKTGTARFISHLDLMRTVKRAFLRSGIELKYSQGYNPHPYMSVALPLPVGCESVCELLDVDLLRDFIPPGLPDILSGALPSGIRVSDAYVPDRKLSEIARIRLEGRLFYDGAADTAAIADCLTRASIVIAKKTKSGISDLDIAPHIGGLTITQDGEHTAVIRVTVSAQNPSVTPADLASALGGYNPGCAVFRRLELTDASGNVFR